MENITGFPVTYQDFLTTRLYLVDEFREEVRKKSILIVGPRRFGKTSLLKEFIRQNSEISENEFNTLFLELEGCENIENFCFCLFKELLTLYRFHRYIDQVKNFLGDIWNAIASRISKIPIPELDLELREKTRDMSFSQWKEKLTPMIEGLNSFNKNTIMIFDEFSDMVMNFLKEYPHFEESVDALNGWLRTLRQTSDMGLGCKYQFVFCGSINLRKSLENMGISKRINDLESFVIPPMENSEAKTLITSLTESYSMEIDQKGIEFMTSRITDGPPYYGQIFFKALKETRKKSFTGMEVEGVYNVMLREGNHDLSHFHSRLVDYLSPLKRECSSLLLKHLTHETWDEKELFDQYFYETYDYQTYQSVVDRLIYEGYIKRDINDNGKLRFMSYLLKDWWAYKTRGAR